MSPRRGERLGSVRLPAAAAEKVKFVEAELAATLNKLDDMLAGPTGPCTEVDDPDGLVRFTLSLDPWTSGLRVGL